jgi:tetratricopeptide (TPR) repeat protein
METIPVYSKGQNFKRMVAVAMGGELIWSTMQHLNIPVFRTARANTSFWLLCLAILSAPAFGQSDSDPIPAEEPDSDLVIPIEAEPDLAPVLDQDLASLSIPDSAEQEDAGFVLDRLEARTTLDDYLRNRQYEQAIDVADTVLELTERELGANSMEMVPVLNQMGIALVRAGRPAEALPHFVRSIDLIKNQVGLFAPVLVEPTFGLGLAYQGMGDHGNAIDTFQRAQHVTHRDKGVVNLDQIPILQSIAVSYMSQDKWTEAETLQLLSYKIHRRNYGDDDVDALPALYELAGWYHSIGDFRQARLIYRRGLKILEKAGLEGSLEALPALRGIQKAYLADDGEQRPKSLRLQQEITEIADAHADQVSRDAQIQSHLELADLYLVLDQKTKAWKEYRVVWEMVNDSPAGLERDWDDLFSRPKLLFAGGDLPINVMGYGVVGKEVYYDFEFVIGRDGRPDDIEIINTNLHGQTRKAAIHIFRLARFRPVIVDGATVPTPSYRVRRIYPTDPPPNYQTVKIGPG